MTVSRILELLPGALEWMVRFRLPALRSFGDMVVRRMFFMPPDLDLSTVEFVVLTSAGRLVAAGDELVRVGGATEPPGPAPGTGHDPTLSDRFAHHLALVDIDSADCLGLGEKGTSPPVLLHLKMEAGIGKATALLQRPPSTAFYELLPAVGVEYLGGEERDGLFAAAFRHRLPAHLEAGEMAGFSRTGHCNEFFLRHCSIDGDLEIGLVRASDDRIGGGACRAATSVGALADRACSQSLAMTCEPPAPAEPYAYGDLVPLGFVLRALGEAHAGLRDRLLGAREAAYGLITPAG